MSVCIHLFRVTWRAFASVAALFAAAGPLEAAVIQWNAPAGGPFQQGSNWQGGVAPSATDRATFNVAGAYAVTFAGSISNERLQLRQGDVQFQLGGSTYALTLAVFSSIQLGVLAGDSASLSVSGGVLQAHESVIGVFSGAGGEVALVGSGAQWLHSGGLIIGDAGSGSLVVAGGARAASTLTCSVGRQNGSTGDVTVTGGGSRLECGGEIRVGVLSVERIAGTSAVDGIARGANPQGSLDVRSGGRVEADSIRIGQAGVLSGNGTVVGDVLNDGLVAPGGGAGTLRIEGEFIQGPSGELRLDIGGPTPGSQHDVLEATDGGAFEGRVSVSLLNGYVPAVGQTFLVVLLPATIVPLQFDSIVASPPLPDGTRFVAQRTGGGIVLRVAPESLPGDINGDGLVNAHDLASVLGAWGPGPSPADTNDDGVVNAFDLANVLGSWTG